VSAIVAIALTATLLVAPAAERTASAPPPRAVSAPPPAATATDARSRRCPPAPPEPAHPISRREWISGVAITEYYPVPERWSAGLPVHTPGLTGRHAVDWLYSARGVSMEGDGIDSRGHQVHISSLGDEGWVNPAGHPTHPLCPGIWSAGPPYWRAGGWRNGHGAVTYPLRGGKWSNGAPRRKLSYRGVSFSPGPSLPLRYYHSIATDPRLIPRGSRVLIPAYRAVNGGWFVAQDTGGAIKARHIDVYRPPPDSPSDQGRDLRDQRVYVIPPG